MRPIVLRPAADVRLIERLADSAGADAITARLYASRGVQSANELDTALARLLPIRSLEHVDRAVDLLLKHRDSPVLIIGDFDADGATSSALMLRCLGRFGFRDVGYLVPNRFEYGYGLSPEIVAVAAQRSPALIVTVDNGISSISGVAAARTAGIDVLVTDHHLPGSVLPQAHVIVNPNLPGSRFASRSLAGVGVAFYVLAALGRRLEDAGMTGASRIPAEYLDLVALGTVADVVPLDHNNRVLVSQGLARIRAGRSVPGLKALLERSGRCLTTAVSADLGFAAGPRVNAAGRLDDIAIGIECLLTDDAAVATRHAAMLDAINRERRDIERDMREAAFAQVDRLRPEGLPRCICIFDRHWHQGVVGLVAARVRERCHRPSIAFARDRDGLLKGSVRSVPDVNARDLLAAVHSACPGLIRKFGGHAMAAGLSLAESDLPAFQAALDDVLSSRYLDADFSGAIVSDGELPPAALTLKFARRLRAAGPWGAGFPEPVWHGRFTILEQRVVGDGHLKMRVTPGRNSGRIDAIAFHQAGAFWRGPVELVYRLEVNEFRGVASPQLVVEQIAAARRHENGDNIARAPVQPGTD